MNAVCDKCWFEMRLEPESFKERMSFSGTDIIKPELEFKNQTNPDPFEVRGGRKNYYTGQNSK